MNSITMPPLDMVSLHSILNVDRPHESKAGSVDRVCGLCVNTKSLSRRSVEKYLYCVFLTFTADVSWSYQDVWENHVPYSVQNVAEIVQNTIIDSEISYDFPLICQVPWFFHDNVLFWGSQWLPVNSLSNKQTPSPVIYDLTPLSTSHIEQALTDILFQWPWGAD